MITYATKGINFIPPGQYNMRFTGGEFWAVRRKSDGRLFPSVKGVRTTRTEFDNVGPPRLWSSRAAATNTLRIWCKGIWKIGVEWDAHNEYGEGSYITTTPGPSQEKCGVRRFEDYEVISVALVQMEMLP